PSSSPPTNAAPKKERKTLPVADYESPFSGYQVDLGKLFSLSELNSEEIIEALRQENIKVIFLGPGAQEKNTGLSLSSSDIRSLEKDFESKRNGRTLAKYLAPFSHIESIDEVNQKPVLTKLPYNKEPVLVVRTNEAKPHV